MDSKRSFVHAGKYFAFTTLFGLLGLAMVGGGIYYGVVNASPMPVAGTTLPVPTAAGAPGVLLVVLGVVTWRLGKAWALYRTLTAAHEEQLADTFDTQHVKSDIVSVLDDRLSDMQQDLQSVNREVRDLKQDDDNGF